MIRYFTTVPIILTKTKSSPPKNIPTIKLIIITTNVNRMTSCRVGQVTFLSSSFVSLKKAVGVGINISPCHPEFISGSSPMGDFLQQNKMLKQVQHDKRISYSIKNLLTCKEEKGKINERQFKFMKKIRKAVVPAAGPRLALAFALSIISARGGQAVARLMLRL